jgi:hypothetical protein
MIIAGIHPLGGCRQHFGDFQVVVVVVVVVVKRLSSGCFSESWGMYCVVD